MLEQAVKLQYETRLTDGTVRNIFTVTKNIILRCVNSASSDPEEWKEIKTQETAEFTTQFRIDPKLGGNGSIWGNTVEVHIYQPDSHQIAKFILDRVMAYIITTQDKKIVLRNEEHGITIFGQTPQPDTTHK